MLRANFSLSLPIHFFSILFTLLCSNLFSTPCSCLEKPRPIVEAKGGYFFFSDEKMRKIYDSGGLDLQLATSYPFYFWKNRVSFEIYASVEYLERSGRSLNYHQKTTIWEIPVNLGLKPLFVLSRWIHYYFALGPRYFYVHQHNRSLYVDKIQTKNGIGLFVNTGFNFILREHFLIDIFGEYSYSSIHCHPSKTNVYGQSIQLGGFTFGGGLGYVF